MQKEKPHQERSDARRRAVQILYQSAMTGENAMQIVETGVFASEVGQPCEYTTMLVTGVVSNKAEIDDMLAKTSDNWAVDRMPAVDIEILRMATFEMLHVDDVPLSVSINEAVELAHAFGGEDDSHKFINGVLGKIAKLIQQRVGQS